VFKRNANLVIDALQKEFPDFDYVKNENKPRRQSFEIVFETDGKTIQIWSGINRTPRREKFPEISMIVEEINKHLC